MEMPTEWKESSNGQLIFINRKDSNRLLEVYVKRSLSLTEGYLSPESPGGPEQRKSKWVNVRPRRLRRHSSDSILHSPSGKDAVEDLVLEGGLTPPPPTPTGPPADLFPLQPSGMFRMHDEEAAKEKVKEKEVKPEVSVSKKRRKPSLWKSFLGLFSKKWEEEEEEEEKKEVEEIPRGVAVGEGFPSREELSGISAACLPLAPGTGQQKKSRRKRGSKKYRSFRKSFRKTSRKDITCVEPIVNVQPTDSYFEKVSEEMELIVHQVKDKDGEKVLTDEEVINRIIALTIKEGDVIDEKLKENPALSNFFQGMSYSAFKKLADTYLEDETAPPVQGEAEPSLPRAAAPPTAPELVKLAFTLDFTARVAGLSRLNVGHITGLGNRYLADRFDYTQACTDHPWSDSEDDKKHQD